MAVITNWRQWVVASSVDVQHACRTLQEQKLI